MGLFDEVVLDGQTRSLLGEYAGDGVFQTKYWVSEGGYISVYNFVTVRKRICCPISINIELLVKPRPEFICEEPLMRRLKLEEIGTVEKIQAKASATIYINNSSDLAKLLTDNGFRLRETRDKYNYSSIRQKFATIPLKQETTLKVRKIELNDSSEENKHESRQDEDLLSLLKKTRVLVYIDDGQRGVAVPPGSIIEVNLHSLEVYIEEMQKHSYKEEEWVKNSQEEAGPELKVIIEHQFPVKVEIESIITSGLDDKVRDQINHAVEEVSNLLSKILT